MAEGGQTNSEYVDATVYLHNWLALTRTPLSVDHVKRYPDIKIQTADRAAIDKIIGWLDLRDLTCKENPWGDNVRLVVELEKRNGAIETVYASRGELCTSNPRCCRAIDSRFREKFNFYQSCFGQCHAEWTDDKKQKEP